MFYFDLLVTLFGECFDAVRRGQGPGPGPASRSSECNSLLWKLFPHPMVENMSRGLQLKSGTNKQLMKNLSFLHTPDTVSLALKLEDGQLSFSKAKQPLGVIV